VTGARAALTAAESGNASAEPAYAASARVGVRRAGRGAAPLRGLREPRRPEDAMRLPGTRVRALVCVPRGPHKHHRIPGARSSSGPTPEPLTHH
jgi:hypothetical protein